MKNTKLNKRSPKAKMIALFICIMLASSAFAQPTNIGPSNVDINWYNDGNIIQGFNAAMIDNQNTAYIIASAYYEGTGSTSIYVNDYSLTSTTGIASSIGTMGGVPDIIIGNITGLPGSLCSGLIPFRHLISAIFI